MSEFSEFERRQEHFSIFEQYYSSYKLLRDAYIKSEYKTSVVEGYLRGAYSLLHIAIENLIKSGLSITIKTHDLLKLNQMYEELHKSKAPEELFEVVKQINGYGYPVNSSLRYKYDAGFPLYLLNLDWNYYITTELWRISFKVEEENTEEWFIKHYERKAKLAKFRAEREEKSDS
jgi:hypothetical protein